MKVLLKLFDTNDQAADGSNIPRSSVEKYLNSEDYKIVMRDHLALGGVTHKDRKVDSKYSDVIAPDDQILVDENITHYISRIFLKPGDSVCYAEIMVLDPENYAGKRKENIMNLVADLKAGVKLPCSVVIQALWNSMNVAEEIIRIKGVDFTLGPSFESAGVLKVFSLTGTSTDGEHTKVFSINSEIVATTPSANNLKEVIRKYGRNSEEYKHVKMFGTLSEYLVIKNSVEKTNQSEEAARNSELLQKLIRMKEKLSDIIGPQNDEILDDLIEEDKEKLLEIVDSIPGTADADESDVLLTERMNEYVRSVPRVAHFSSVNSIRDRMLFIKLPRYSLINRIIKSYKKYYEANKDTMDESEMKWLEVLFIQDLNILIRNVVDRINKGSTLDNLYALVQFGDEVKSTGIEFSRIYRQVLLSEKVLGFIPEVKYLKFTASLNAFLNAMCRYTFGSDMHISLSTMDKLVKI